MDIKMGFWVATVVMAVIAFAFVARPLLAKGKRMTLTVSVIITLAILAGGLYLKLGSPQLVFAGSKTSISDSSNTATAESGGGTNVGSVASMVDGLAKRLAADPSDGGSWLLLARSYKHLNRMDDALAAYEKASALGNTDPEFESLIAGHGDSSVVKAQIYGIVSLSTEAAEIVQPTDTVFVFAKAVSGPSMPAAVLRRPASDLPLDFLLNDAQSMVDGIKLSDFNEVIVTARITRSGDVTDGLKGLEASSDPITVSDNNHLTLIIQ